MTRSAPPQPTEPANGMETTMAKGSYGEIVALLEYFDKKTATPVKIKHRGGKAKTKKFDLVELLRTKKEETEMLEKFLEEQAKLKKKEDKKPEPNKIKLHGLEWFIIGILSYPFVGTVYQAMLAVPK